MSNRYLHMLSWGIIYSSFSLIIVWLYKALACSEKITKFKFRKSAIVKVYRSDFWIYLIITTISAIRINTGSDYYNYYKHFNQIKESFSSLKEVIFQQGGYSAVSYIIKCFTDYEYAIFIVVAIASYFHLFHLIRSEVEDTSCAIICYFFLGYYAYSNNIIKQYIAMAFVMSAYLCFERKKMVRMVLYALLAVYFHYSAGLILVIIFLVRKIQPSLCKYYLFILVGIVGAILLNYLFAIFLQLVPSASGYAKYLNWRRSDQFRLRAAVAGMSLIYAILTYFIVKYREQIKEKNIQRYNEIIFLMVGLCINIVSLREWIINRVSIYFYQFIILILPCMFSGIETKKCKKLKYMLYTCMFLYMIFSSVFLGENEYFSYNTIFSGDAVISDVQYNIIHGWSKK